MPKLAFQMQRQLQSQWCWAAVSSSISSFYGGPNGPSGVPWKQCEVANNAHALATCCDDGSTDECNRDGMLDQGLVVVSHLAGPATGAPENFAYVQQEIDNGHPIGVRITWNQGDAHAVVISGYDTQNGTQLVDVEDPYYDSSTYEIGAFTTGYLSGKGQWNNTYPIQ